MSQLPQMDKARALLLVTEALTFDAYNATTDAVRRSGARAGRQLANGGKATHQRQSQM